LGKSEQKGVFRNPIGYRLLQNLPGVAKVCCHMAAQVG
jgi:hypothetical protein